MKLVGVSLCLQNAHLESARVRAMRVTALVPVLPVDALGWL